MNGGLRVEVCTGDALAARVPELARLRIEVFRDFPYLYEGDLDYEARYLETYIRAPGSVVVLALDGDRAVGASTAVPLVHETEEVRRPFADAGFDVELGCIGVNVCYDVEFPLLSRRHVEAGAELLLAPSCTDTLAGYHRVRIGCQARAMENQCYVVQAPTVGEAPWSEAVDVNVGAAGVYAPPDRGLPDDGVVAVGRLNAPGWMFAEVDPARIADVRREGQVFNHRDWDGQVRPEIGAAERVTLR
ncbi:nitrilase-related carbon-nitrogen hydrolase [Acidihalobacter aeolianus]|uniref:nitrilase-related carbon-nitrogen hydrolase n=1 Tax=Acidihalobacter aeolianus TaxID=2792603 RepID=UPI0009F55844|nr:nitrilase-related carbon-nitrogen hydrolase [Acidihalobacter aeolianus]